MMLIFITKILLPVGRGFNTLCLLWQQCENSNLCRERNNVLRRVKQRNVKKIMCFQLHLLFATTIYMLNALLGNYYPCLAKLWTVQ